MWLLTGRYLILVLLKVLLKTEAVYGAPKVTCWQAQITYTCVLICQPELTWVGVLKYWRISFCDFHLYMLVKLTHVQFDFIFMWGFTKEMQYQKSSYVQSFAEVFIYFFFFDFPRKLSFYMRKTNVVVWTVPWMEYGETNKISVDKLIQSKCLSLDSVGDLELYKGHNICLCLLLACYMILFTNNY